MGDAEARDRQGILGATVDVGVFNHTDLETVEELLDTYLKQPEGGEYTFIVARDAQGNVLGFTCYGPTPLTEGTFDMYWLAVTKAAQGQGLGTALFLAAEEAIRSLGGRLIVLETSGTAEYEPARKMYERLGWTGRT